MSVTLSSRQRHRPRHSPNKYENKNTIDVYRLMNSNAIHFHKLEKVARQGCQL